MELRSETELRNGGKWLECWERGLEVVEHVNLSKGNANEEKSSDL